MQIACGLLHQTGQYALRRGPWRVLAVLPRALSVVEMRQDRLITAGASMAAMSFIFPPQVSQVSNSILNTRFRRCAHVIAAWRSAGGSSALTA